MNEEQQKFVNTANDAAMELMRTALWDKQACNWIGNAVEKRDESWQTVDKNFFNELYSGTSGIAIFLAYLYHYANDPLVLRTIEGALTHARLLLYRKDVPLSNYGFYNGRLGIGHTFMVAGELAGRQDWKAFGADVILEVCKKELHDTELDVVGGAAGAILFLKKFFQHSQKQEVFDAIVRAGNFLLLKAKSGNGNCAWDTPGFNAPLTGFAHGAAGMSTALLEAYELTQDEKYLATALAGLNFENEFFNDKANNWQDTRTGGNNKNPDHYGSSWCHGAPGIALARLRAYQLRPLGQFKSDAIRALETTMRITDQQLENPQVEANFSLCHGLAGNADILLFGAMVLGNNLYKNTAARIASYGIDRYGNTGLVWPSGVFDPSGKTRGMRKTPGLMLGVAGIGYFYLRMAFPDQVGCMLLPGNN